MSTQSCIVFFALFLILGHTILAEDYVYEKVVPKPDTEAFKQCHYHLVGTIYACWIDAAAHFHAEQENILMQWPSSSAACCAVWEALRCFDIKTETYPPCKSAEVVNYYKQVERKYIDNGCQAYTPDRFDCFNHGVNETTPKVSLFTNYNTLAQSALESMANTTVQLLDLQTEINQLETSKSAADQIKLIGKLEELIKQNKESQRHYHHDLLQCNLTFIEKYIFESSFSNSQILLLNLLDVESKVRAMKTN